MAEAHLRFFSANVNDEKKLDALLQNVGILKLTLVDPCLLVKNQIP